MILLQCKYTELLGYLTAQGYIMTKAYMDHPFTAEVKQFVGREGLLLVLVSRKKVFISRIPNMKEFKRAKAKRPIRVLKLRPIT